MVLVCVLLLLLSTFVSSLRPNILFLQCDEMDGRILDVSHPLSHVTSMPYLTRLASKGVIFDRAYAENPLCAPSRASTWTGRRTSSIRAWHNVKALATLIGNPNQPDPTCASIVGYGKDWCVEEGQLQKVNTSIRHWLEDVGYEVAMYGKMDTGGGICSHPNGFCYGSGYHDNGNWTNGGGGGCNGTDCKTYFPGDLLHSWGAAANISKPVFQPLEASNGWINLHNSKGGPHTRDWKDIDKCVKYLQTYRSGNNTQPFFLYCSVLDPHPPYFTNATWLSQVNDIVLNQTLANSRWQPVHLMHPSDRFQTESEGVPFSYDADLTYRLARAWHGQTAETDAMMGTVLEALAASEASNNTFILFTSDHGEMHLEHRHVEKQTHYEGSARVPMIISGPGVPQNKHVSNLVSLLDVFPTFIDIAGDTPPDWTDGYSLLSLANMTSHDARMRPDHVTAMATCETNNVGQFMIRQGKWKYIAYANHKEPHAFPPQLFDIETDPEESNSVASQHSELCEQLDQILRKEIDYPTVMNDIATAAYSWVHRWIDAYPNDAWRTLVKHAYRQFDDDDMAKFEKWLNSTL